jgi:hypothetical protein
VTDVRFANRIVEGLTLVAIGLIFLGSTLGYLPWSITTTFLAMISLWPVLLVTFGLDIVGRAVGTPWLRLLSSVIMLGAVVYGGLVLPATDTTLSFFSIPGVSSGESNPFDFYAPRNGVRKATLNVKGAIGEITMGEASGSTLVRMSGYTPFGNPELDVNRSPGRAEIVASMGANQVAMPVTGRATLDLLLSPYVTWDVVFETGASTLKADLQQIPLSAFTLKTGASDSRITLGSVPAGEGEVPIRVESGAAAITLLIPDDAEARVEAQTGLASVTVPSDFDRVGGNGKNYESPEYASTSRRYLIRVQTGVGAVNIKRY